MRLKIIKKSSPWKKIVSTVLNAELRENCKDLLDRSKKNRSKMEQNHYLGLLVWFICHNQNITYSPWYSWKIAFMVFSLHRIGYVRVLVYLTSEGLYWIWRPPYQQINFGEYQRGNQKRTIQRNRKQRVHEAKKHKTKTQHNMCWTPLYAAKHK